jgi:anti-sigma regulatory factor (Ser/Thr protein kinase)
MRLESDRLCAPSADLSGRTRSYVREAYVAVPDSVPEARRAITEFAAAAGATGSQLDAIRLSASEALTNIVRHAYPSRTGHIHLTVRVAGAELWVLIADNGCGIHAGRDGDGLGLGLTLIAQMTDGFSIVERSCGGTELRLRYTLPTNVPAPARLTPRARRPN